MLKNADPGRGLLVFITLTYSRAGGPGHPIESDRSDRSDRTNRINRIDPIQLAPDGNNDVIALRPEKFGAVNHFKKR
jgi:hypothetical protein